MSVSNTEKPSVLLISDMAGYGKVALSAMIPVLSYLRQDVSTLPTALVSNTFDYGRFSLLDTSGYIEEALADWEELGFTFDAVFVGFLASRHQCDLIRSYCESMRSEGAPVYFDPIMGDWGKLYNGISDEDVSYRKLMCSAADVIVPNLTEAQYLCGEFIGKKDVSESEAVRLVGGLKKLGASSVVITSAQVEGTCCTIVAEDGSDGFEAIQYDELPIQMHGTGDIFSSALMGADLEGSSLKDSVRFAMNVVSLLLERCLECTDCLRGVPVETHLEGVLEKAGWLHD